MISCINLDVETSPGTAIEDACEELMRLARLLNVVVTSNFNGVTLLACPDGTPEKLEESWRKEVARRDVIHRVARS